MSVKEWAEPEVILQSVVIWGNCHVTPLNSVFADVTVVLFDENHHVFPSESGINNQ